ncbi:23S rRNA methyltransferase [Metapseudomonas resinovorans]|uniref:FAD-binding protein n=1 Tax=Metapseudomonas resinovorans TaxID=53412 RepID=UPI0009869F34|nr:FAD-binding protein [Pseudomonas resinovorans]GLZ87239.1 23S rRNA methyltransferase [Pseudomonas resinovorans]
MTAMEQSPETPLRVRDAAQLNWDDSADLLVVGFGGAGVCAAIEAASQGVSVLALERFAGGGATARSGGVVYAGGGTPHQAEAGVEDSPEAMFDYLRQEVGDAVSAETLRGFCENSVANLAWLERHGAAFQGSVPPLKTSYPSDQYFLYYSGNEAVPSYAAQARPAPRGHRALGSGMSGINLFRPLAASAQQLGVRVQRQSEVRRLVLDDSGAVLGVEAWALPAGSRAAKKHARLSRWTDAIHPYAPALADRWRRKLRALELTHAKRRLIRAHHGVLLSAGGFVFNRAMLTVNAPRYLDGLPLGTSGCDGSGIRLGQSVGGRTARMERASAWRFINPPLAWARGLIVNAEGRRYCNEEVYGARLGHAMVEEQGGRAILILNRALMKEAYAQVGPGKVWSFQRLPAVLNMLFNARRGRSLAELAERSGLPQANLERTVAAYNAAARGDRDDELGKSKAFLAPLDEGPWYALDLSFDSKLFPCPVITLGGLTVCERSGQVLADDGQPVPGLFSAGRNAVGVASNFYVSGLSLADCVHSGRRVGVYVAGLVRAALASQGEQQ